MTHAPHLVLRLKGGDVLYDAQDWYVVDSHTWRVYRGYAWTSIRNENTGRYQNIGMHRLILGIGSDRVADHVNHCGLDNRRVNLRAATTQENAFNRPGTTRNRTGVRCVYESGNRFMVQVGLNYKRVSGGSFPTMEKAIAARDALIAKLHGNFGSFAR